MMPNWKHLVLSLVMAFAIGFGCCQPGVAQQVDTNLNDGQATTSPLAVRIEIANTSDREIDLAECARELNLSDVIDLKVTTIAPGETLVIVGDPTNLAAVLALCEKVVSFSTTSQGEVDSDGAATNGHADEPFVSSERPHVNLNSSLAAITGYDHAHDEWRANPLSLMVLPNSSDPQAPLWSQEPQRPSTRARNASRPDEEALDNDEENAASAIAQRIPEPTLLSCIFVLILAAAAGLLVRWRDKPIVA